MRSLIMMSIPKRDSRQNNLCLKCYTQLSKLSINYNKYDFKNLIPYFKTLKNEILKYYNKI